MDDRSYAFVVKIWEEQREIADAVPMCRGSIEDVQTGARQYFNSLMELCAMLNQRTGMAGPTAGARRPRRRRQCIGGRTSRDEGERRDGRQDE